MSKMTNAGRRACISSRKPVQVGNHDTPYPREEPAGENPPEGVVLDYFLPAPAASVEIEIRDGRLSEQPLLGSLD